MRAVYNEQGKSGIIEGIAYSLSIHSEHTENVLTNSTDICIEWQSFH